MALDDQFPKRLESLRKGLTQRQFAKLLGIPLTSYTNWIAGLRSPSAEAIYQICSQLGVSSDWLLGLSDVLESHGRQDRRKLENLKKAIRNILDEY